MEGSVCKDTTQMLSNIDRLDKHERKRVLGNVLEVLAGSEASTALCAPPENAILSLYTIATKHNTSSEEMKQFVSNLQLQEEFIGDILKIYQLIREDIKFKLCRYTHTNIPMASDLNWRLSSVLRCGKKDVNSELVYKVTFAAVGQPDIATFDCSFEELQHLSSKFKEIERNCLKLAEQTGSTIAVDHQLD